MDKPGTANTSISNARTETEVGLWTEFRLKGVENIVSTIAVGASTTQKLPKDLRLQKGLRSDR